MYIAMAAVLALVMGYYLCLVKFVYPRHPEWDLTGAHNRPQTAQVQSSTTTEPAPTSMADESLSAGPATTQAVGLKPAAAPEAMPAEIGSTTPRDPNYRLALQIDPDGAAIAAVALNEDKAVDGKDIYRFQQPYPGIDQYRTLATRSITVNGQSVDLADVPWQKQSQTASSAAYSIDIQSPSGAPVVRLTKRFIIDKGAANNNTAAGYEVSVDYQVQNLTAQPQTVRIDFDGPIMPPREIERGDDRQVVVGFEKADHVVDVVRNSLGDFKPGAADKDFSRSEKGYKFLWAGATSNYFAAIVRPQNPEQIDAVHGGVLNPDDPAEQRLADFEFQTTDLKLKPGGAEDVPLRAFFGPKVRQMLEGEYYSDFPRSYNQLLSSSSGYCGICAVPWLVDRLVDLLRAFHWLLHDWGLAIILLVIVVRLLLHPITKSSQVSMMKMQKMAPELERLKKKYGEDKEAYAKAQMEIYKEMGVTPILGCLPMFLQMPIWIALYSALQNEIALRQQPFLWGFTWIHDLARPDRMITWDAHPLTIPFFGMRIVSLNILPILMAVAMYLQQKIQPMAPAATPEQASQQKMMRWMSLLFPILMYSMPSGLILYILTSTAIGVVESKRIRDHIKQREEAEKANKVIVDAKPTRAVKQSKKQVSPTSAPKPAGRLSTWWANMQRRVEEMRDEAERNRTKK
jgi:YidC/Oxa1 family membrane protein insertase